MLREQLQVGVKVVCTYDEAQREPPLVFGKTGIISHLIDDMGTVRIQWDDAALDATHRGYGYWGDAHRLFELADDPKNQEMIEHAKDQQRRHLHAMKYL